MWYTFFVCTQSRNDQGSQIVVKGSPQMSQGSQIIVRRDQLTVLNEILCIAKLGSSKYTIGDFNYEEHFCENDLNLENIFVILRNVFI